MKSQLNLKSTSQICNVPLWCVTRIAENMSYTAEEVTGFKTQYSQSTHSPTCLVAWSILDVPGLYSSVDFMGITNHPLIKFDPIRG